MFFPFASKDFVFPFLRWILLDFELECIFKKTSKIIQSVLCRMNKRDLFLSTNVLFFDALTILIHHSVLFFSILSQKEKFSVKRKKEFSVKLHDFFFHILCRMDIYFRRLIVYQSRITMIMRTRNLLHYYVIFNLN